jgi:CheY-like chemotaxis protein/HPt (histidine-containing phosphotransfer) domain-containing protein
LSLLNDILDFSKIEAGKLDLDPVDFELRDAVERTLNTLALRAHQKGLELAGHVLPDVPDRLVGDPVRLRQIIVNLVGNAIKFTEKGEVVVRVELERQSDAGVVLRLAVRDTGIGIPPEHQQRIFEAFTQADGSTTRKYGGTGLGLSISLQLVRMMGGRIWLDSEVGKGSTFHFTANLGLQVTLAEQAPALQPVELHALRVLVVDDNLTNRRILQDMLTSWGMVPTLVADGLEAVATLTKAAAEGDPYVVVLLDYMMPGMDGLTVAAEIKRNPALSRSTVIMLSSACDLGSLARGEQYGLAGYLTKPVRRNELLNAIHSAVGSRQPPPAAALDSALAEPAPSTLRLRILVAEDNVVNQKLAVRILEKRGHSVAVAGNGKDAMMTLEKERFDVVLMDVQMPKIDGLEATAIIREGERTSGTHLPIVAMTAHAMAGDWERCLAAGMDAYVPNPLDAKRLFEAIDRLVNAEPPTELPAAPERVSPMVAFDREHALAQVDGDEDLLREIAGLFLQDSRPMLDDIAVAVRDSDALALERAAHKLMGSVGVLGAKRLQELVQRLEQMGHDHRSAGAAPAFDDLKKSMEALWHELERLGREEPANSCVS